MSKLQQITEGLTNHLTPSQYLEPQIIEISKQRLAICELCEFHSKNHFSTRPDVHCIKCGCNLGAKTKCLTCECPIDKWGTATIKTNDENN